MPYTTADIRNLALVGFRLNAERIRIARFFLSSRGALLHRAILPCFQSTGPCLTYHNYNGIMGVFGHSLRRQKT